MSGRTKRVAMTEERIQVAANIAEIRQNDPARAREIQRSVAGDFEQHFRSGLAVVGFEKSEQHGTYLLGKWDFE